MHFSRPKLHPPVVTSDQHRTLVRDKVEALAASRPKADERVAAGSRLVVPLTTVALSGNFDSYIHVQFPNPGGTPFSYPLLVDSGNTCMVVPHSEMVNTGLYRDFGATTEPWGCPAYLLQGPLRIPTLDGSLYVIENCLFYACYADNPNGGGRTANFGTGRVDPWSPTDMSAPAPKVIQSPLSYGSYTFAEFVYGPAVAMLPYPYNADPLVTDGSLLILNSYMPSGYTMLGIIPNLEWMSVVPASLEIGTTTTGWPGSVASPIAMIDTGGGPASLSDPNGYVYPKTWPDPVTCPSWISDPSLPSTNCTCISDRLGIGLGGANGMGSYSYAIDTGGMPRPVRGLTAVMCQTNGFMMGEQGMNVGGLSMLFNRLLIEYEGMRVGLAPRHAGWPPTVEMSASVDQPVAVSPAGVLLGYDNFTPGILTTTLTVSWSGLPAGATICIRYDGSEGAQVAPPRQPDRSTAASGRLTATVTIKRVPGAAVPVYIYVFGYEYLPLNIRLTATTHRAGQPDAT